MKYIEIRVRSVEIFLLLQSWQLYNCLIIARLLELNKSIVSRVLHHHNECGSVENRSRTRRPPLISPRAKRVLFTCRYCSTMSRNPEMHHYRKLRISLIKVELEECLNVLHNELFVRKAINGGSLGRQFSCVYQTKGTERPGAGASCICP